MGGVGVVFYLGFDRTHAGNGMFTLLIFSFRFLITSRMHNAGG
jgi:hypothetical protein